MEYRFFAHPIREVMKLMRKYENLGDLLQQNPAARRFFDTLPDYVRETIEERGDNIRYDRDLRGYAEKLLRGDD